MVFLTKLRSVVRTFVNSNDSYGTSESLESICVIAFFVIMLASKNKHVLKLNAD